MIDLHKIHKGMDVLTSDGRRIGSVDEVMEQVLFLNGVEADPDAKKTSIPMIWIIAIDDAVRLAKSWDQVQQEWQAGAASSL